MPVAFVSMQRNCWALNRRGMRRCRDEVSCAS